MLNCNAIKSLFYNGFKLELSDFLFICVIPDSACNGGIVLSTEVTLLTPGGTCAEYTNFERCNWIIHKPEDNPVSTSS